MQTSLDYKSALARYPDHVASVMAKLRKGKSKHKSAKPEELKWFINWCVIVQAIQGSSLADFLNSSGSRDRDSEPQSEAEFIERAKGRTKCSLFAKAKSGSSWFGGSIYDCEATKPGILPKEIEDLERKSYRKQKKDDERRAAMSVEEKDEETNRLIGELRKSPGFCEIRF